MDREPGPCIWWCRCGTYMRGIEPKAITHQCLLCVRRLLRLNQMLNMFDFSLEMWLRESWDED